MRKSPFYPIASDLMLLETDRAIAFLDTYPVSEGHALVVPKKIVKSLYDLNEADHAAVWELVAIVRELLKEKNNPDGFNIGVNDGAVAGQTINHAHVHVIPRYEGDSKDPRGGIRWVLPDKAAYWEEK